jgi:RNA polymerase primary sigma factor
LGNSNRRQKLGELDILIEKADVQGFLTSDDLLEFDPEVGGDVDRLESIMFSLRKHGVEILLDDDSLRDEDDEVYQELDFDDDDDELDLPDTDMDPYMDLAPISSDDTIGLYMKEMARVPLLSVEEELDLAKRIEAGEKAEKRLEKLNGNASYEQKEELRMIAEDGLMARAHLIKANTRLVVSIAKRYIGRGVPFLDLIQEGNLGLMKAVKKYEYKRGFRFSTYATWWIRQTITRSIADQGRTIRVPVHMVDRIRQLYRVSHELEQKLGSVPTTEELAEAVNLPISKVEWMLQVSWLPLSLESPINDDEEETELGMFVEDTNTPTPIQSSYSKLLSEKLEAVLETLPPREARILKMRFGLVNGRTYTLEEVGEKFGLTRERIRQIESKALRRLRHPRRARQLKEYL